MLHSQIFTFTLLLFMFSMRTLQFLVGFICISEFKWKTNRWFFFVVRRAPPTQRRHRALNTSESQHQRCFSGNSGVSFVIVSDLRLQDGDNPEARIKPKPQSASVGKGGGEKEVSHSNIFLAKHILVIKIFLYFNYKECFFTYCKYLF